MEARHLAIVGYLWGQGTVKEIRNLIPATALSIFMVQHNYCGIVLGRQRKAV